MFYIRVEYRLSVTAKGFRVHRLITFAGFEFIISVISPRNGIFEHAGGRDEMRREYCEFERRIRGARPKAGLRKGLIKNSFIYVKRRAGWRREGESGEIGKRITARYCEGMLILMRFRYDRSHYNIISPHNMCFPRSLERVLG